jgi:hypothetical protein
MKPQLAGKGSTSYATASRPIEDGISPPDDAVTVRLLLLSPEFLNRVTQ